MNRYQIIYVLLMAVFFASCREDVMPDSTVGNQVKLVGIRATIDNGIGLTRAADNVPKLTETIGRSEFAANDKIIFTAIRRTTKPMPNFTYTDVEYHWNEGDSWIRPDQDEVDIYWTDNSSHHTFIGYCLPHPAGQPATQENFDWKKNDYTYTSDGTQQTISTWYGSIGNPLNASEEIDYNAKEGDEFKNILSREDLLLAYNDMLTSTDMVANVCFHHALAAMRVSVTLTGFSTQENDNDSKAKVTELKVLNQPVMYKWSESNHVTTQLVGGSEVGGGGDQSILNTLWQGKSPIPQYDQKKTMKLWQPQPDGEGSGTGRHFNFYGITVPGIQQVVDMQFTVQYQDPTNPTNQLTQTYTAKLAPESSEGVKFQAGYCTSITVNLNHKNEKVTIGAEYQPWMFEETPDFGELHKNTTFLESTERNKVTILGDSKATVDDATWLYVDKVNSKIKDIYGNDGSKTSPFQISTADQLLSFAYEVKGASRTAIGYTDNNNQPQSLAEGASFSFEGYYVALDAGLTLQPNEKITKEELVLKNITSGDEYNAAPTAKSWIGIGDKGKPFNGTFMGGVRLISRLYDSPFFVELGPKAHVDQLILEKVIGIHGNGGFASVNEGVICACKVDGNVTSDATEPVGSFVGTNGGVVFACYHTGDLTAKNASAVGGLVGQIGSTGLIVASYNYGQITGKNSETTFGVLGQNGADHPVVHGCFYDKTKASNVVDVAPGLATTDSYPSRGLTTVEMMKSSFAGAKNSEDKSCLNGIINVWAESMSETLSKFGYDADHFKKHYYVSQPAGYPYVY